MPTTITSDRVDITNWCLSTPFTEPGFSDADQIILAQRHNLAGVELFSDEKSADLKAAGLTNPMMFTSYPKSTGLAPFEIGFATKDPDQYKLVETETRRLIDVAAKHGFKNVIAFTGYGDPTEASKNLAIARLIEVGRYAQGKNVSLCLEHLNNKEFHGPKGPMMGHPGYMGHDINFVADIVNGARKGGAGSGVSLLFDWYHVTIMHPGQEYELFERHIAIIGHVHLAQNPGRIALDADGTLVFSKVSRTIAESALPEKIGVGCEFLVKDGTDAATADVVNSIGIITGTL